MDAANVAQDVSQTETGMCSVCRASDLGITYSNVWLYPWKKDEKYNNQYDRDETPDRRCELLYDRALGISHMMNAIEPDAIDVTPDLVLRCCLQLSLLKEDYHRMYMYVKDAGQDNYYGEEFFWNHVEDVEDPQSVGFRGKSYGDWVSVMFGQHGIEVEVQGGAFDGMMANTKKYAKAKYNHRRRNEKRKVKKQVMYQEEIVAELRARKEHGEAFKDIEVAKLDNLVRQNVNKRLGRQKRVVENYRRMGERLQKRIIEGEKERERLRTVYEKIAEEIPSQDRFKKYQKPKRVPKTQSPKRNKNKERQQRMDQLERERQLENEFEGLSINESHVETQAEDEEVRTKRKSAARKAAEFLGGYAVGYFGVQFMMYFFMQGFEVFGQVQYMNILTQQVTKVAKFAEGCEHRYNDVRDAAREFMLRRLGLRPKQLTEGGEIGVDIQLETVIHVVEKMYLLLRSLLSAKTTVDRCHIVALFVSCHLEKGISNTVMLHLTNLLSSHDVETQAGLVETLQDVDEIWRKFKDSRATHKILEVISYLVVTGMSSVFSMKFEDFNIGKYVMAQRGLRKDAPVFEILVDEVMFFIQKGLSYYKEGSFVSIFYDDDKSKEYDERYATIVAQFAHVETNDIDEKCGISMNTYLSNVQLCLEETKKLAKKIDKQHERRYLVERNIRLQKILDATQNVLKGRNMRIKPYGLMLYGGPGCGKTVSKSLLMQLIMLHNPQYFSGQADTICTMNGDDAYQTEVTNAHQVIVLDDLANARPDQAQNNPCQSVINMLNNEPKAVLKADVEGKGKVFYNCNLVVVTTNDPYIQAHSYSIEPSAVLRRFNVIVEVHVKEAYKEPGGTAIDATKVSSLYDEAVEYDVYRRIPGLNHQSVQAFCKLGDKELKRCTFDELSQYLTADSKKHFAQQEQLLKDQVKVHELTLCQHGRLNKMCRECVYVQTEAGVRDVVKAIGFITAIHSEWDVLRDQLVFLWLSCTIVLMFSTLFGNYIVHAASIGLFVCCCYHVWRMFDRVAAVRFEPKYKFEMTARQRKYAGIVGLSPIGVATLIFLLNKLRSIMALTRAVETQGQKLCVPTTTQENEENVWVVKPRETAAEHRLKTMTIEQGLGVVERRVATAQFDNKLVTNIFPICSNVWIVNWHILHRKPGFVKVVIGDGAPLGPSFKSQIHPLQYQRIGETDLALLYLPSGGSQKNLIHMLPVKHTAVGTKAHLYHRNSDGTVLHDVLNVQPQILNVTTDYGEGAKGVGLIYKTTKATFSGLCMAPIVSDGKIPMILGFHFGKGPTDVGFAQQVTQQQILDTLDLMFNKENSAVCKTASSVEPKLDFPEHGITVQYGEVHPKCPSNYVVEGHTRIHGAIKNPQSGYYSRVVQTKIAQDVAEKFDYPVKFGPPKNIANYKPRLAEFEKACNTKELPFHYVQMAYEDLINKLDEGLSRLVMEKSHIGKIDDDINLAGLDGKRGFEAINLNSSMGFPINRPKKHYVWQSDKEVDGISCPRETHQVFFDDVQRMEEAAIRGERFFPIAKAHLKDEPKKLTSEKVRVFYGTSFAFLLLTRRYLLSLTKFYMDHPTLFETTVGINVFGPEWDDMARMLTRDGSDHIVAGDFASWDTTMSAQMILLGGKFFVHLAKWSGMYDDDDIKVIEGIFTELAYPMIDFFGTFVEFSGCLISGVSVTIVLNDIVQMITHRVVYYDIYDGKPPCPFHEAVTLKTNGDDNIMAIGKQVRDKFNHSTMQAKYAEYGMVYTMADKESESVPFVRLEDADYLKRKFRYSIRHERYHPALDKDSIMKSLQVCIPSKDLCEDELCAINIDGALQEAYYHGSQYFHEMRSGLEEIAEKHGLKFWFKNGQLKTYEECERFDIKQYLTGRQGPIRQELVEVQNGTLPKIRVAECETNTNLYGGIGYQNDFVSANNFNLGLPSFAEIPRDLPLFRGESALNQVLYWRARDPVPSNEYKWIPESQQINSFGHVTNNVATEQERDQHQTLAFRDGKIGQWISAIPNIFDRTRDVAMTNDVPLQKFFERPIQVADYLWDPADVTKFYRTFDPWTNYFGNARIINRINNYQLIRAKLKVKFVINGNAFYYGKMMVDYGVRTDQDNVSLYGTGTTLNTLMGASQRLHIYLDPTESQGGVLCLPYIGEYNNMRIPEAQWSQQGRLYLREMSPLKHSNGSVVPVSIVAYAWAEDVMLSIPTKENSAALITQAGEQQFVQQQQQGQELAIVDPVEMNDGPRVAGFIESLVEPVLPKISVKVTTQAGEYGSSPISNMMSTAAEIAGRLVDIPMIAPYAKATQLFSGAMGSIAKIFGFSRPVQIENQTLMRRFLIGPMANADRGDTATKLTVDSKQELSIDPRTFGVVPVDEMQLSYIASKETWFARVPWATTDRINKLLFNCWVTPMMWNYVAPYYHNTASAFASLPFQYWRGTVIYRFSIVASAYHRGRLLFSYAPNQQSGAAQTQTQYTRIVDLTSERDFTIEVCWASEKSFLKIQDQNPTSPPWSTFPIGSSGDVYNGTISIFVLNDLTAPSDTVNNDITIHCFMRCGDDFAVAVPHERFKNITYLNSVAPQAGHITTQAGEEQDTSSETNAPVKDDVQECVAKEIETDNTFDVYFGERIVSFRTLLKRYMYHTSYLFRGAANQINYVGDNDFPVYRGSTAEGRHPTTTTPWNIVETTLVNYVAPAYVGYKGGIRYKYIARTAGTGVSGRMQVARANNPGVYGKGTGVAYNQVNDSQFAVTTRPFYNLITGGEVTDLTVSPVLEVELPYYNIVRFTFTRLLTFSTSFYNRLVHILELTSSATNTVVDRYVSVGEDFTLFLFQGQPPYQFNADPAVPAT